MSRRRAARCPLAHIREWLERGPSVPFYVMYGATEAAARLTYLEPDRLRDKLGSIGRPIPNVEIAVLREDGAAAAPGEVGELVARGSNIACGYWNKPDESRERFGPDGYRTGDLGYADDEGFLFLVGRKHDMIKIGAHRVGPREIEEVLLEHAAVHEAAVVGGPRRDSRRSRGGVRLAPRRSHGDCRGAARSLRLAPAVVQGAVAVHLPG